MTIFALCYIAMVPCANLIGFAGQELARKMPRVFGILVETTLGKDTHQETLFLGLGFLYYS